MDSWKIFLLICQLAYLLFLSLVAFAKSFFEHLGVITCDDNYVCYTALTALKACDSCLWYLDSGCSRVVSIEDVWYVDGLKANLLSISQICDNDLNVLFTKYECEILDGGGDYMCIGVRTVDNCYGITPSISNKCFSAKIN